MLRRRSRQLRFTCFTINRIFGTAIAISAALNLLVPGAARMGYGYLMVVRVLQGLVEVIHLLRLPL
jgi:hypothetical protein